MFMYQVFIIYLSQTNTYHIFKGTKLQVHTGILGIHIFVPQYFNQLMALNYNTCLVLKLWSYTARGFNKNLFNFSTIIYSNLITESF